MSDKSTSLPVPGPLPALGGTGVSGPFAALGGTGVPGPFTALGGTGVPGPFAALGGTGVPGPLSALSGTGVPGPLPALAGTGVADIAGMTFLLFSDVGSGHDATGVFSGTNDTKLMAIFFSGFRLKNIKIGIKKTKL